MTYANSYQFTIVVAVGLGVPEQGASATKVGE